MANVEIYARRNQKLKRLRDGAEVDPGSASAGARFPGDPGRGKIFLGANHVDGGTIANIDAGRGTGLPIEQFELAVFPASEGYTTANRPKFGIVREYSTTLFIDTGLRNKLNNWADQGRICNVSIQTKAGPTDTYTSATVLAALEDTGVNPLKTSLLEMFEWLTTRTYPIWLTINHEPQSHVKFNDAGEKIEWEKVLPSQAEDWRKLARKMITMIKNTNGGGNVAFVGPHPVSDDYRANKNWKQFHPEYIDATNGWSTTQYLDMDGWDPYNPRLAVGSGMISAADSPDNHVHFQQGARTKKYSDNLYLEYKNRVAAETGYHHKPMCIGELGLYAFDEWLWNTEDGDNNPGGITFEVFFDDLVNTCYATDTVAVCLWNNTNAGYTDREDPYGVKRAGLRKQYTKPNSKMVMAGWDWSATLS